VDPRAQHQEVSQAAPKVRSKQKDSFGLGDLCQQMQRQQNDEVKKEEMRK